jgi:hypothetical protein
MKQRGRKLASKPRLNMSFSELVQRINQKDLNGEPKQKKNDAHASETWEEIGECNSPLN